MKKKLFDKFEKTLLTPGTKIRYKCMLHERNKSDKKIYSLHNSSHQNLTICSKDKS